MLTRARWLVIAAMVGGSFVGGTALAGGSPPGAPDALDSGPSGPLANLVTGHCAVGKVSFAASNIEGYGLTSSSYVDVPDMAVTFSVPGTAQSCAIATFSAVTSTDADQLMMVRALMDRSTLATPSDVLLDGDSDEDGDGLWARAHSFTFVFTRVAPGKHTIRMRWRSFSGGGVVLGRRTLVVQHA